jgi:hypothetical protein
LNSLEYWKQTRRNIFFRHFIFFCFLGEKKPSTKFSFSFFFP